MEGVRVIGRATCQRRCGVHGLEFEQQCQSCLLQVQASITQGKRKGWRNNITSNAGGVTNNSGLDIYLAYLCKSQEKPRSL